MNVSEEGGAIQSIGEAASAFLAAVPSTETLGNQKDACLRGRREENVPNAEP